MARYQPDHKEGTRRRMIEVSGQRFKREGFDGTGIATLVKDASLTNGAFYGHFASKDDLIAAVVADQLATQRATIEARPPGSESLDAFVRAYLSPAHRDDPGGGCPTAALLDEIPRCDEATRRAFTEGTSALIDTIAGRLGAVGADDARGRAIALYGLLVASLQLARAVADPEMTEEILASGQRYASRIADLPTSSSRPS